MLAAALRIQTMAAARLPTRRGHATAPSVTRMMLLATHDTAPMQHIRTRLADDAAIQVVVELCPSPAAVASSLSAHRPNLVVCMDDAAACSLPAAAFQSAEIPCITFAEEGGVLRAVRALAPPAQGRVTGPVWSSKPAPALPNRSHWLHGPVDTGKADAVVDIARRHRYGMPPPAQSPGHARSDGLVHPLGQSYPLLMRSDERLIDGLGPVDFSGHALDVAARIDAADCAPGTPHHIGGMDMLLYGAHSEDGGDVSRAGLPSARPGEIVAQRDGAVAIQCGKGVVWVSHMKGVGLGSVKLPSTLALPHHLLRGVPTAPALPLILTQSHTPATFQDVYGTVRDGVGYLHFPTYNSVLRADQAARVRACFRELAAHPSVGVVVLTGGGRLCFSRGMDFNAIHASTHPFSRAWETMNALNDMVLEMLTCAAKPVVCALGGDASAGGVMAAAACDAVWAREDIILNPHYKAMGLHGSDYWTYTLPRRVGADTARRLTSALQPVTAATALECGLVDALLPADEFTHTLHDHAAALASDAPRLRALLAAKPLSPEDAADMARARGYEAVHMRDNLKEYGHAQLRRQLVEKEVPRTTPLYLAGQKSAFGRVLDGKQLAQIKIQAMKDHVASMKSSGHSVPRLGLLLVGDRPDSRKYVQHKIKACKDVGVESVVVRVPLEDATDGKELTQALIERVRSLNDDVSVHGIIVQLPLPPGVDTPRVLAEISPGKDVDGFGAEHLGALAGGVSRYAGPAAVQASEATPAAPRPFVPCTAAGIMELLNHYHISVAGKHVVIVGRSPIVGMPAQLLFMQRNATVHGCDIHTPDLKEQVSQADILVVAAGSAELVKGAWIKPGAVVIDVGINFDKQGKMVGDVEFGAASGSASFITPVPGGVGPMTVAMLLQNTLQAFTQQQHGHA